MPRNSAPTKATGGGGYTFADKVAASFLAQILQRAFPVGSELGVISQLHFETRDSGQILDDLRLILTHGTELTNCAISVKSNRPLTNKGFNVEFVQDAWDQWNSPGFDKKADILCLIVGVVDAPTLEEWLTLQGQASSTEPEAPGRTAQRLANSQQSSAFQRAIFESLRREQNGVQPDPVETVRLASRIRVLSFAAEDEGKYINLCAATVLDGTLEEGTKLWGRLLQLAAENRARGGFFDLPKLVRTLRPDFELRDYPDFEADWNRVEAVSRQNLENVRTVLGADIHLPRTDELNGLSQTIAGHKAVVIVGESGSGKSSAVSQLAAYGGAFKRTLWLTAEQLSKSSQAEIAHVFDLNHSIPDLIRNSSLRSCVLVLDGFEKFEGDARKRALELVAAVNGEDFTGWKLIVTCQPQALESTRDALIEAGVIEIRRFDFEKPAARAISDAIPDMPEIRALLARGHLQPILRNLAILDWVLRGEIAKRISDSPKPWIGETDLINWIWEGWIGHGTTRIARDSLLRTLGRREGEKLSGAVHVDSIDPTQFTLLGALAQEGLIRESLPAVQFRHDLMGDWARFRELVCAENSAIAQIKAAAQLPRWGRAIRFYAQSLAEQADGLAGWKAAVAQLSGDDADAVLASDIFLDGLLFATNSVVLLELVWPDLIAEGGAILLRLLKRLRNAASMPDIRLRVLVNPKYADQSEAWFRIPNPLYWYPALSIFSRHAKDVAQHALLPAAEACALWLRTMPGDFPGRREAALLALELARETQGKIAEGLHFGDKDKGVYEALLWAAPEFPDEVAQIALELGCRREEPKHAIERAIAAQEREAKWRAEWLRNHPEERSPKHRPPLDIFSISEGPMRAQAVDGPARAVSEGFRSAVLDTGALAGLVTARPDVASEVLLAVCIGEPRRTEIHRDRFPLRENCGLAHWGDGYPAGYWKGPFLLFLQKAPVHGLDAILRLVNYATNRLLEEHFGRKPTEEERQSFSLEFEVDGKTRFWLGNANQFAWYRSHSLGSPAVESALMALEKWLYDEVANNRSVSESLTTLLLHAESIAFAGVLVSLGLKYPVLFTRELQPLLGNFFVYQLQLSLAVSEMHNGWAIPYAGQPQPIIQLATEWNQMPHRHYHLQDLAPQLMLEHSDTRNYLSDRVAEWAKQPTKTEKDREQLQFFLARFDLKNYTETPQPDGRVMITMRWPEELEAKVKQGQDDRELKMLSLTLSSAARASLSGDKELQPTEVPAFARQIRRLADWHPSGSGARQDQYHLNSLAGGIAVLIIQHRDWLRQNPEIEKWCIDTLRELRPAEESDPDSPMSVFDHTAESFLGEAGVALLLESDEDWVLRLAFEGITGFYYNSTFQTMLRAYWLRAQLGEKFGELTNIVVLWSALRRAANRESRYEANRDLLAKYKATLFSRYAAGKLKGKWLPLTKAVTLGNRLVDRVSRRIMSPTQRQMREAHKEWLREHGRDGKLDREIPSLDFYVLQNGLGFLWGMVREQLPADEPMLRHYIRELFDMEMRTLPKPGPGEENFEIEGTSSEFDTWGLARVAEFIVREDSLEVARTFSRPILDLGPAGRYWVEDFLRTWVRVGLEMTSDPITFAKIWTDMVDYAMGLPAWQPSARGRWSRAESLAVNLVGMHEGAASVLGQAKHKEVVQAMAPAFERWAGMWLNHASIAGWFAHFLTTESGEVVLAMGIKRLAAVVGSFGDGDWHQQGLGGIFTDALATSWKNLRNEIDLQPDLRTAFLTILAKLCARDVPEALHLRTKVSGAIRTKTESEPS